MSNPIISIVMPVCNSAPYLDRCLDSLAVQTYRDFELICVDDCSDDDSVAILRERQKDDDRIVVVERSERGGGGAARNAGISRIRGTYTAFLDSDDFFDSCLLEKCLENAQQYDADIVLFDANKYDSIRQEVIAEGGFIRIDEMPGKVPFSRTDIPASIMHITSPAPWLRFYKTSFIVENDLRFQEIPNSNDYSFGLLSLVCAERITFIPDRLVYYRMNNKSSTQGQKSARIDCVVAAIEHLHGELIKRDLFGDVSGSFCSAALSTLVFSLRTADANGREKLLELVSKPDFYKLDLLGHEEDHYQNELTYTYARMVESAIKEVRRRNGDQKDVKGEVLIGSAEEDVLVSVVVPVFDAEDYLDETLKSLVGQSMKQLEIICVDDGSTDDSLQLLRSWASRDGRIAVFHQANKGLSAARNAGMSLAKGEFVYFMDSDDILEENAFELLYRRAVADRLDVIYFDAVPFFDDETLVKEFPTLAHQYRRSHDYLGVYSGKDMLVEMRSNGEYLTSACLQFCRLDFLRSAGISFYEGIIHEDNLFTFEVLLSAKRVGYMGRAFFHRRIRSNSIMTKPASFDSAYGYFVCHEQMREKLEAARGDESLDETLFALVYQTLENSRFQFAHMPPGEVGRIYGLGLRYHPFRSLVASYHDLQLEIERMTRLYNGMRALRDEKDGQLQRAYDEKSEINAKLQKTYDEKFDRGVRIKELENELSSNAKKIKKLERENRSLRESKDALAKKLSRVLASRSYRLGRAFVKPLQILRKSAR